jgi:hypothetical protein
MPNSQQPLSRTVAHEPGHMFSHIGKNLPYSGEEFPGSFLETFHERVAAPLEEGLTRLRGHWVSGVAAAHCPRHPPPEIAARRRIVLIPAFRLGDRLPVTSQCLDLSTETTEPALVSRTRDQLGRAGHSAARAFAQLRCCPTLHYKPLLCAELAHGSGDDATHRLRT